MKSMNYIINTNTNWNEPPRARHQIAFALSKKYPVKFISANKFGFPKIKEIEVKKNLTVIQPYFPIDYRLRYRLPLINEFYQNWLFRKILSLLGRDTDNFRVINSDFTAVNIFNYFKNIAYYCNDDFISNSEFTNPLSIIVKFHNRWEDEMIRKATFCITTSDFLTEKLKEKNNNVYEIPLGAPDISEFEIEPSLDISEKEFINAGLIGFINCRKISAKTINLLLEHPKIKLTFIGPVGKRFMNRIDKKDRITIEGTLTGKDLYSEINNFDVAIAPYNLEKINKGGTPNKLWQYIAMGKPVVVSDLPAMRSWTFPDGCIYRSSDEKFLESILNAYETNTTDLIKKRISIAKNNTWDKRVGKIIKIFEIY
jgi:glycosyltransferase involved in cell wall biosynthesis